MWASVRTCSLCDSPFHDIRRCPNRPPSPQPPLSAPPSQQEIEAAREERIRYAAFKASEEASKAAAAVAAAEAAAAAAAERRDEQSRAVASFQRQIEKYLEERYKQSDDEIIRLGKIWKINGGGDDYQGHEWLRLWRESRYSGRVARRLNASEPQPGFDYFDGWPTKDEADIEVSKIAYSEWQKWQSFCIRFAERAS